MKKYVKNSVLSLFVCWSLMGCNQANKKDIVPEVSSITKEIQQANMEEQKKKAEEEKKKQYRENIAQYVYYSSIAGKIYNKTDYTIEKVVLLTKKYDIDSRQFIYGTEEVTYIPAHSEKYAPTYAEQIQSIKCTALGMY